MRKVALIVLIVWLAQPLSAREYHVSPSGLDTNEGSAAQPLKTIAAAAQKAQSGDVITVHAGTYRERVNPPRGGESDQNRIVYQAAPGERVVIKGSEVVRGWQKVQDDTWKVTLPNSFFGDFNPYRDLIHGDWFSPKGRNHHTGAVYLNGHWLIEAAKLEDVLKPVGGASGYAPGSGQYLLNVAWLRPGDGAGSAGRIPAAGFAAQHGIQKAPCSEGGECIGWIEHGDWVRYERIDFGSRTEQMEIRAASETTGGIIEIRLDTAEGELLGTCSVPNTGGWQSWSSFKAKIKPVSGIKTLCLAFKGPQIGSVGRPVVVCPGGRDEYHHLGAVQGRQSERGRGRDQCPPDGVLSGQAGHQFHHRARLHDDARGHALGAAYGRADRPDRHPLEQGLDHRG